MQSSSYGGFFYLIVGAHAAARRRVRSSRWPGRWCGSTRTGLTGSQLATVSAFWYFVVLVWPVLYWKVYL